MNTHITDHSQLYGERGEPAVRHTYGRARGTTTAALTNVTIEGVTAASSSSTEASFPSRRKRHDRDALALHHRSPTRLQPPPPATFRAPASTPSEPCNFLTRPSPAAAPSRLHHAISKQPTAAACTSATASLIMSQGTPFDNCVADSGSTLAIRGGTAVYMLPAPPGRWVAAATCEVYREACDTTNPSNNRGGFDCPSARAACSALTTSDATTVDGVLCEPLLFSQPCDWSSTPQLLGEAVHALPQAPVNVAYPYCCAAGLLGSNATEGQGAALCGGFTPAGTYQPEPGGLVALASRTLLPCGDGGSTSVAWRQSLERDRSDERRGVHDDRASRDPRMANTCWYERREVGLGVPWQPGIVQNRSNDRKWRP